MSLSFKGFDVRFSADNVAVSAGLVAVDGLLDKLGFNCLVNSSCIGLDRERFGEGCDPGVPLKSLLFMMLTGGDHIQHVDRLRTGAGVNNQLGFNVLSGSRLGEYMRGFTKESVDALRDINRLFSSEIESVTRKDSDGLEVIDIDSSYSRPGCGVKENQTSTYKADPCYHPLVATDSDGAILDSMLREGKANTVRGAEEIVGRVLKDRPVESVIVRADSGFWVWNLIHKIVSENQFYLIKAIKKAGVINTIAGMDETVWGEPFTEEYTGLPAQYAEACYQPNSRDKKLNKVIGQQRMIVKRVAQNGQISLTTSTDSSVVVADGYDYFVYFTNLDPGTFNCATVESLYRKRVKIELTIKDLKEQAGDRYPHKKFVANSVWFHTAVLAHNLNVWIQKLAKIGPVIKTNQTMRYCFWLVPAIVKKHARTTRLCFPNQWPHQTNFMKILKTIKTII